MAAVVGLVVVLPAAAWAGGGMHLRLSSTSGARGGCYVYFPVAGPVAGPVAPEVSCRKDAGGCIIGIETGVTAAGYAPISFARPAA